MKKKRSKTVRLTIDIDPIVAREIKIIAAEKDLFLFELAEIALRDYSKRYRQITEGKGEDILKDEFNQEIAVI